MRQQSLTWKITNTLQPTQRKLNADLQDVVEGNVLGDMSIADDELDILGTVDAHLVPEEQQSLLVVVHGDGRF